MYNNVDTTEKSKVKTYSLAYLPYYLSHLHVPCSLHDGLLFRTQSMFLLVSADNVHQLPISSIF